MKPKYQDGKPEEMPRLYSMKDIQKLSAKPGKKPLAISSLHSRAKTRGIEPTIKVSDWTGLYTWKQAQAILANYGRGQDAVKVWRSIESRDRKAS